MADTAWRLVSNRIISYPADVQCSILIPTLISPGAKTARFPAFGLISRQLLPRQLFGGNKAQTPSFSLPAEQVWSPPPHPQRDGKYDSDSNGQKKEKVHGADKSFWFWY